MHKNILPDCYNRGRPILNGNSQICNDKEKKEVSQLSPDPMTKRKKRSGNVRLLQTVQHREEDPATTQNHKRKKNDSKSLRIIQIVSKLRGKLSLAGVPIATKSQRMHKRDVQLIASQRLLNQISLYFASSQLTSYCLMLAENIISCYEI